MTDNRPGYSRTAAYGDYFRVVADPSAPEPKKAKINVLAIARIGMSRSAIESGPGDQARDHAGHLGPAATPAPSATVGCVRTSCARPARCARATTRTRPAADKRLDHRTPPGRRRRR